MLLRIFCFQKISLSTNNTSFIFVKTKDNINKKEVKINLKMKSIVLTFIIILCIFSLCSMNIFASSQSFSFYCIRNKEHNQPNLDSNINFIEDYDGYYVDRKCSENTGEKVIYLTFDAGYENGNIEKILDVMKNENVKGAFFILENLIIKNPELIKRMTNEGHLVCNHTSKHRDITSIKNVEDLEKELQITEKLYKELTGKEMKKYFRPPEGRFDLNSMKCLQQLGYKTIFWSFAYADWDNNNQMSSEKAKEKIFENIHNGEIMLLHPTSATNAEILGEVILTLKKDGYRFATLDELIENNQL